MPIVDGEAKRSEDSSWTFLQEEGSETENTGECGDLDGAGRSLEDWSLGWVCAWDWDSSSGSDWDRWNIWGGGWCNSDDLGDSGWDAGLVGGGGQADGWHGAWLIGLDGGWWVDWSVDRAGVVVHWWGDWGGCCNVAGG